MVIFCSSNLPLTISSTLSLILVIFVVPTGSASATDRRECGCITRLVYDVIMANDLQTLTFLFTDGDEGPLSPLCLATSGLPQRLSQAGVQVKFLYVEPDVKYDSEDNFVAVYNNATRLVMSKASDKGDLLTAAWLVITPPGMRRDFMNQVNNFNCFLDSTILVALWHHDECQSKIESPYKVGPRGGVIVENLGFWNDSRGFVLRSNASKHERRSDFQGYPMRGIGVRVFKHFTEYLENGEVSGFFGEIVSKLKSVHNFTLTYRTLKGYAYGTVIDAKNNKWNGMVGELQNKRADLTITELAYSRERVRVVDYTQPVCIVSYNLFTSTPEDLEQKLLVYTLPMESSVFVCVFFTLIICFFSLVSLERIRCHFLPQKVDGEPISFSLAAWYLTSIIFQQGNETKKSATTSRVIFLFVFILALIMYTSYSAKLVSQLAVERPTPLPFSNIDELSYQTDWDAGSNRNDFFQVISSQECANATTEQCRVLNRLWTNIISKREDNPAVNYMEGLKTSLKRKYVFIGVDVSTRYFLSQMPREDSCRIRMLPGNYLPISLGVGLQHSSPFKKTFDRTIQKMRENGVVNKLVEDYLRMDPKCSQDTVVVTEPMDVVTLFIILMIGMVFSMVFLFCEIGVSTFNKNKPTFVQKF